MFNVSISAAFTGGFLTFFSACVLPLLPLYFSYMAGEALSENDRESRIKLMVNSIGFVIGLSILNILIGFGARFLSDFLIRNKEFMRVAGGSLLLLFGIYFVSMKHIPFLERDRKVTYKSYSPSFLKSIVLGFTFSLGWSACNGPIVASIALIASFQQDYFRAGGLMLVYSLGFALPFLLAAFAAGKAYNKFKAINKHLGKIKIVSGIVLIIMGLMMLLDKMYIFM